MIWLAILVVAFILDEIFSNLRMDSKKLKDEMDEKEIEKNIQVRDLECRIAELEEEKDEAEYYSTQKRYRQEDRFMFGLD